MLAEAKRARLRTILAGSVDMDALRKLAASDGIEPADLGGVESCRLSRRVPLINGVSAGYPSGFTDLGFPARVADDYVMVPDGPEDPDLFAARVVGDSMTPDYRDGDVIVMSPRAKFREGMACFCRFEGAGDTTFKQVFTENDGDECVRVRLHPTNASYPERVYPREDLAGVYPVLYHIRKVTT